ncbi:hypothetical protein QAD02_012519 [Eretmocerus hayati]|uniref:Uncharacterized protein n=1 Tax=Eretmocerus hayati TaxID=131215 RepID=A0ACC2P018_9HYME|nr:hypothetical protein QAD02_012519 [Eretmocerus hayati]
MSTHLSSIPIKLSGSGQHFRFVGVPLMGSIVRFPTAFCNISGSNYDWFLVRNFLQKMISSSEYAQKKKKRDVAEPLFSFLQTHGDLLARMQMEGRFRGNHQNWDLIALTEICSSALTDVIHAVINGTDGCLFCFGHAGLGKTYTMLGTAEAGHTLGAIPCAIAWLFRGISEQRQKTGARFSVRVSCVELIAGQQQLKDLLATQTNGTYIVISLIISSPSILPMPNRDE